MNNQKLINQILKNSKTIEELNANVAETFKNKNINIKPWIDATNLFNQSYDTLAFPGGLNNALILLKKQDNTILSTVFTFLKTDPYFFRSGYIKQKILRLLKKFKFTEKDRKELQEILINNIITHSRREYKDYYNLGLKIFDIQAKDKLKEIINLSKDKDIKNHAQKLLDYLLSHKD